MARIAFLLPTMGGGGTERVVLSLVNGAVRRGHHVDLLLMKAEGPNIAFVDPLVRIVDFSVPRVRNSISPLARYLRSEVPAALQVSMWPLTVAAIIAARIARTTTRIVTTDHNPLSLQYRDKRFSLAILKMSTRFFYPMANHRLAVSSGTSSDLQRICRASVQTIYNPIPSVGEGRMSLEAWRGTSRRVLSIGSFKAQKNHALLLEAFARVDPKFDAGLVVVGDGELREQLEQKTEELGLQNRVFLVGHVPDPAPYYRAAELFVLSSDYEGFGNVIVEAMSAGLPIVSTDCPTGPAEILEHGRFGTLVPCNDADALARAIERALTEQVDVAAQKLRASAFQEDAAVDQYLNLMLF